MLACFLAFILSKYNQMTDIKLDEGYCLIGLVWFLFHVISFIQWEPKEIIWRVINI